MDEQRKKSLDGLHGRLILQVARGEKSPVVAAIEIRKYAEYLENEIPRIEQAAEEILEELGKLK